MKAKFAAEHHQIYEDGSVLLSMVVLTRQGWAGNLNGGSN